MAHAHPYDHETVMYFFDRAIEVLQAAHPKLSFEPGAEEVNEKFTRVFNHIIHEYENIKGTDYFKDGDFKLSHDQVVAIIDRTVAVIKATRAETSSNPSYAQIQDRYSRIFHHLLWQYHWFLKHDCKRNDK